MYETIFFYHNFKITTEIYIHNIIENNYSTHFLLQPSQQIIKIY